MSTHQEKASTHSGTMSARLETMSATQKTIGTHQETMTTQQGIDHLSGGQQNHTGTLILILPLNIARVAIFQDLPLIHFSMSLT